MQFKDKFVRGFFVSREISHELLADVRSLPSFLRYVFEALHDEAQWGIHGHLEPTKEQRDAYTDSLMRLPPWEFNSPPPEPWKDWRTEAMPEPVFTSIAPTPHETICISFVFGGVLRVQFADLKTGDRLTRADWPNLIATVTQKEAEMVELHIGNRGGAACYYPAEFEQQPFERAPAPVKTNANTSR
jgi:hypothetical protein